MVRLRVTALLLVEVVCTNSCRAAERARLPASGVVLDERRCGEALEIQPGSVIRVRLHPLAGAGYSWALGAIEGNVSLTTERAVPAESPSLPTDKDQLFTLEVSGGGVAVLTFQHMQPWVRPAKPIATCSFTLRLRRQ